MNDPDRTSSPGRTPAGKEVSDTIIRIDHVTKVFPGSQAVTAVSDISFEVRRGEIFGLLGPNGAGKSTLIRILTTLMKPTSGTAFVGTFDVTRDEEKVRGIIGVCPQNSTLDLELTAYDNLDFYGQLLNVPEKTLDYRIWELLAMAGLEDRAYARTSTFSGGMRRKLEIVRAFLHRPLILFLDEPTIGLDPEARREVWHQISLLNDERITIILTTHYMDEAEKLCDRIAFMDQGRLITLDTPENLKQSLPEGDLIEIGLEHPDDAVISALRQHELLRSVELKGRNLVISARNGSRALPLIFPELERLSIPVTSVSIRSPSLEDVFIHLTGRGLSDKTNGGPDTGGTG